MERWHYPQGKRMEPYKAGSRRIIEDAIRRKITELMPLPEQPPVDLAHAKFYYRHSKGNRIIECLWHGRKLILDIHPGFFRASDKKKI